MVVYIGQTLKKNRSLFHANHGMPLWLVLFIFLKGQVSPKGPVQWFWLIHYTMYTLLHLPIRSVKGGSMYMYQWPHEPFTMETHMVTDVYMPCTHTSLPWHTTPASSLCPQSLMPHPLKGHWSRDDSEPLQKTSSIQMGPVPWPNSALVEALIVPLYPSCLHTTWVHAQKSIHMCCTVATQRLIFRFLFWFKINLCLRFYFYFFNSSGY